MAPLCNKAHSVNPLARCLASNWRYAARILACARSNTAKPESLPDIPSAQPPAYLMAHGFVAVVIGLNGAAAAALLGRWAINHLVDLIAGEHGAVAALVSGLSAQAFAARGACAWCARCAWAVAGGWLAAVGAVHVEALFELRDTSFERSNDRSNEFADGV